MVWRWAKQCLLAFLVCAVPGAGASATTTPAVTTTAAAGTRVVRGRYVRIGALKVARRGDSNPVLNLAEVQAFSPSGTLLNPVSATLSSNLTGRETASKCIDGSVAQICHSDESDKDPFLVIDYGKPVAIESIQVYNRVDCSGCSERVVGATISIESDAGGEASPNPPQKAQASILKSNGKWKLELSSVNRPL